MDDGPHSDRMTRSGWVPRARLDRSDDDMPLGGLARRGFISEELPFGVHDHVFLDCARRIEERCFRTEKHADLIDSSGADVKRFVRDHSLAADIRMSVAMLREQIPSADYGLRLFDPDDDDGAAVLFIVLRVSAENATADEVVNAFVMGWWYDHVNAERLAITVEYA